MKIKVSILCFQKMFLFELRKEAFRHLAVEHLAGLTLCDLNTRPRALLEDGKIEGQVVHIVKAAKPITMFGPKKSKHSTTYDRMVYLR